jgi:hypothetical protein
MDQFTDFAGTSIKKEEFLYLPALKIRDAFSSPSPLEFLVRERAKLKWVRSNLKIGKGKCKLSK